MIWDLIATLIPIVVAGLTTWAFDRLKGFVSIIDDASPVIKQVAVAVIAFFLTQASVALGVALSTTDITAFTEADVSALLSAGLAYLFHAGKQAKLLREGR